MAGANTYDDTMIYNGSMERYNFKIIGKKEVYVPYNTYRVVYQAKAADLFGPKHLNPDLVRWELHRMWVVEGTLKPGKRHIYQKRRFFLDEDCWAALAGENYDAHGNMFKVYYAFEVPSYDVQAPSARFCLHFNMISNQYVADTWPGAEGRMVYVKTRTIRDWTPATMMGTGIR